MPVSLTATTANNRTSNCFAPLERQLVQPDLGGFGHPVANCCAGIQFARQSMRGPGSGCDEGSGRKGAIKAPNRAWALILRAPRVTVAASACFLVRECCSRCTCRRRSASNLATNPGEDYSGSNSEPRPASHRALRSRAPAFHFGLGGSSAPDGRSGLVAVHFPLRLTDQL